MSNANQRIITGATGAVATSFAAIVKPVDDSFVMPKEPRHKSRFSLARLQAELQSVKKEAAHEGREEGYQEGYSYGRKVGQNEGRQQAYAEGLEQNAQTLAQFTSELDEIGEAFQSAIQRWFQSVEESLESMAVVIAERVIAEELSTRPEAIRALTKECLAEVTHATEARVRVNTAAFEALRGHEQALLALAPSLKNLEFLHDPTQGDGVVIDTEGGRVDGLIQTRLKAMFEGIQEAA